MLLNEDIEPSFEKQQDSNCISYHQYNNHQVSQ